MAVLTNIYRSEDQNGLEFHLQLSAVPPVFGGASCYLVWHVTGTMPYLEVPDHDIENEWSQVGLSLKCFTLGVHDLASLMRLQPPKASAANLQTMCNALAFPRAIFIDLEKQPWTLYIPFKPN